MTIDYDQLNYEKAAAFLPRYEISPFANTLALLDAGDFWQQTRRYHGPPPEDIEGWNLIEKSFAPIHKVLECRDRHARGVIGREPQFEFVSPDITAPKRKRRAVDGYKDKRTPAEAFADDTDSTLGAVWYERGEHSLFKAVCGDLISVERVFLRYDVPPGLIVEGKDRITGEITQGLPVDETPDWQSAYGFIYLEQCVAGSATIHLDTSTMRKTSFYSYVETDESGNENKCVQVTWVDKNKRTQIRVYKADNKNLEWEIDNGGFLLIMEAQSKRLVTPALMRMQDLASSVATMVKINSDIAGFPQTDVTDVAPPVALVPAPTDENPNATKLVPLPMKGGPRTIRAFYSEMARDENGEVILDGAGKPIMMRATVDRREPVSSAPLWDDIYKFNYQVYSGFNQRHIPEQVSGNTSAEYLVEMRSDFADSLMETQPDLTRLMQNCFKARLCMAAYLAGDSAALERFKAGYMSVSLMLHSGPVSVAESAEIRARRKDGLLSDEKAMIMLGENDPDAEMRRIAEQPTRATEVAP